MVAVDMAALVERANGAPGDFTEWDVLDFFRRSNLGHWPSERGQISLEVDDGTLVLDVTATGVESNQPSLTPTGTIWVLGRFFQQFVPQAVVDLDTVLSGPGDEPADAESFRQVLNNRMAGRSQFFRGADGSRHGFVERQRVNGDGSHLISLETANLDRGNDGHRMTLILPGVRPRVHIFSTQDDRVFRWDLEGSANEYDREAPERAAHTATLPLALYQPTPVPPNALAAAFALTATGD